jgi:hydroxypyruvate isomerase
MAKISTCIDMMFASMDFYDRFAAAKNSGIGAVEFWKWSNKDLDKVRNLLDQHQLGFSVFNIDCRDEQLSWDLSRGILNRGRRQELLSALRESIPVYNMLEASGMIVLIGENTDEISRQQQKENIYACLSDAAEAAEKANITLVVEPLNDIDRQNYCMPYAADLLEILNRVDSDHVKMLYDMYHQSVMEDFSLDVIRENIHRIGHFHVADCPGRHEPGTGKVDYVEILRQISQLDYDGYIGLEYRATKPDDQTFGFLKEANILA